MPRQPIETQTLYAELVERLVALETTRRIGHARGSFVTKTVKGGTYYYFQYLEPGGDRRQVYVGRKDDALDRVAAAYRESRADYDTERESIRRLCALLRVGGALVTDAPSARVLRGLADAGVFHLGGVLVGTHAYTVIGNALGTAWRGAAVRTQDIDVAATRTLSIALADTPEADMPGVLESLEMGFLPVPGLDPKHPSTSFKVRGQGLRVDLLTPAGRTGDSTPVTIRRLRTAAQPLRYLDYVVERPVRGAIVDGEGVLVSVPDPARFGFHKLIIADERPAAMHAKRDKDLMQAAEVFSVLTEERPGDIAIAWEAIESRGKRWITLARRGLRSLATMDAAVADHVRRIASA